MNTPASGSAAIFGRFQIVAMSMKQLQGVVAITSTLTARDNVINLHDRSHGAVASASSTHPLLRFE
jgi:hypothetical protein